MSVDKVPEPVSLCDSVGGHVFTTFRYVQVAPVPTRVVVLELVKCQRCGAGVAG